MQKKKKKIIKKLINWEKYIFLCIIIKRIISKPKLKNVLNYLYMNREFNFILNFIFDFSI